MAEYSPSDLQNRDIAIRTILGEEGSLAGQVGVASVLLNRLAAGTYGETLDDVTLSTGQFEAWARQKPELLQISTDDPRYIRAGKILDGVASGSIADPTGGATHFYAPKAQKALGREAPSWGVGEGQKLGSSLFYAPQGRVSYQQLYPAKPDDPMKRGVVMPKEAEGEQGKITPDVPAPAPKAGKLPAWMQSAAPAAATPADKSADTATAKKGDKTPQWMQGATPVDLSTYKPPKPASTTPGYLGTAASELAKAPGDIWQTLKEGYPEATKAAFEKGKENVSEGVAGMKRGDIASGALSDIIGTIQEGMAPVTGGIMTGLEYGSWADPMMAGAEGIPKLPGEREPLKPAGFEERPTVAAKAGTAAVGDELAKPALEPTPLKASDQPFMRKTEGPPSKTPMWMKDAAPVRAEAPITEQPIRAIGGRPIALEHVAPEEGPFQSFGPEESIAFAEQMARENSSLNFPNPVDLYFRGELTADRAAEIRDSIRDNIRAEEDRLLGDRANEWRKLSRSSNSENDERARRASEKLDALENTLSADTRHRLETMDFLKNADDDSWNNLTDDLIDAEEGREGSVRLVSWAIRNISHDVEETPRETLLRISIAMDAEKARGGDPIKLLRDGFQRRYEQYVRQGSSPSDAQEVVMDQMRRTEELLKKMQMKEDVSTAPQASPITAIKQTNKGELEKSVREPTDQPKSEAQPEAQPQSVGAAAAPKPKPMPPIPPRQIIREQEDNFDRLRKATIAEKIQFDKFTKSLPKELQNPELADKFHRFSEGDPQVALTPRERMLYDKYFKPLKDLERDRYEEAANTDLAVDELNPRYAHRIRVGGTHPFDRLAGEAETGNPIFGRRSLPKTTSSMKERVFFAVKGPGGVRKLVARADDGSLRMIEKGQPAYPMSNPKDLKVGQTFVDDRTGQAWTLDDAYTREIEENTDTRYHKNAFANTIDNVIRLGVVNRAVYEARRLTSSPEWQAYAMTRKQWEETDFGRKVGRSDWREPEMPIFRNYHVHPRLANVLDDFYGARSHIPEFVAAVNRAVVGSMFWNPIPHALNAASHWFTARGWDWLKPTGWTSFAVDGARAMHEVVTLGPKYQELLKNGSGMIYGQVVEAKFYERLYRNLGESIVRQPAFWDPIARILGVGPSDLAHMIYAGSARTLWAVSDMFMMQRVLELEGKGMTIREAISEAERHIPAYRSRSELLGSRTLAELYQNPMLFQFSRYHAGMLQSHAHMALDMFGPKATTALGESRRLEALGNYMALAAGVVLFNPGMSWLVQQVPGLQNAQFGARGSTTLPSVAMDKVVHAITQTDWGKKHVPQVLQNYYNGNSDWWIALQNIVPFAPIMRMGLEAYNNRQNFTGQSIIDPDDARNMRVWREAGQAGGYLVRNLFQPEDAAMRAWRQGRSIVKQMAEGAVNLHEPNTEGLASVRKHQAQQSLSRQRYPQDVLENAGNALQNWWDRDVLGGRQ